MRLCSYVVVHDTGFAPNPFGRVCTLAACTPNHQGVKLVDGDWLVGNSSTTTGRRLIYAMRVSTSLDFDDYYRSHTFAEKRADPQNWQRRCGDNIYFRNDAGLWQQALAFHHTSPGDLQKDTRYPRVLISDHFFYFGENAPAIPVRFDSLLQIRQGCRYSRDQALVSAFVSWLERTYKPGVLGLPRDRERNSADTGLVQIQGRNAL